MTRHQPRPALVDLEGHHDELGSWAAVAEHYGVSVTCVHVWLQKLRPEHVRAAATRRRYAWTSDDDRTLCRLWEDVVPLALITNELKRTKDGVMRRACLLGLEMPPPGWEKITVAARRAGFACARDLRSVLEWAGVRLRPVPARYKRSDRPEVKRRKWFRRMIVESLDVDEAVARWCDCESISDAARRYQVTAVTMLRWFREAGLVERHRDRRTKLRVESKVVDAAIKRIRPQLVPPWERDVAVDVVSQFCQSPIKAMEELRHETG